MSHSFEKQIATKIRGAIQFALYLVAGVTILLAGEILVMNSQVAAQSAKQKAAVAKELKAKREQAGCKVTGVGFLFEPGNVQVEVSCPGKDPVTASSRDDAGSGQEILSIALTAITSGKLVYMVLDKPNDPFPQIISLWLANP
jgi:hypothetical protein